jgi:hypothetical protein
MMSGQSGYLWTRKFQISGLNKSLEISSQSAKGIGLAIIQRLLLEREHGFTVYVLDRRPPDDDVSLLQAMSWN